MKRDLADEFYDKLAHDPTGELSRTGWRHTKGIYRFAEQQGAITGCRQHSVIAAAVQQSSHRRLSHAAEWIRPCGDRTAGKRPGTACFAVL